MSRKSFTLETQIIFDIIVYNLFTQKRGGRGRDRDCLKAPVTNHIFSFVSSQPLQIPLPSPSPTKAVFSLLSTKLPSLIKHVLPSPLRLQSFLWASELLSTSVFLQMAAVATLQVFKSNILAFCPRLFLVNLLQHNLITAKYSIRQTLKYD